MLVWLLLLILCGVHQGDSVSDATCCKYNRPLMTYSCKGCQLTEVPNDIPDDSRVLDLSYNNLMLIKDLAFSNLPNLVKLHLNHNQISHIGLVVFQGLVSLKELDLRHNNLCVIDTNLGGLFDPIVQLKTLQLANNECKSVSSGYLNRTLMPLKKLTHLSLPLIVGANLNPTFTKLSNLKHLMLTGSNNEGGTLGCHIFKALENVSLEMLSIRNSGIKQICPSALRPLKDLRYLNLACNANLLFNNVIEAINHLPGPTLETVIIDRVGAGEPSIDTSQVSFLSAWKNVKKFSAQFLNTGHVNLDGVWNCFPELRYAGFAANMIWISYYQEKELLIQFFNNTKLETVDVSHFGGQGYNEEDFNTQFCYPDNIHEEPDLFFRKPPDDIFPPVAQQQNDFDPEITTNEFQFILRNAPSSLKYVYGDFFSFGIIHIFQFKFSPVNQFVLFNLSNSNFFGRFKTLKNLNNLQVLDARNCGFNSLAYRPLYYPSLKKLILSGNNLVNIGSKNMKWSPFKRLKKLKCLDLHDNKINYVTQNAFTDLPSLEELKLAQNDLSVLNFNLTGSPSVKFIDVSHNTITTITDTFMQTVDQIASRTTVSLDLTGNILDCSCETISAIKWFQETDVRIINFGNLTCKHAANVRDINVNKMAFECFMTRTHLSTVLSTMIPTAITIFIVALVYRKRWKIKFRYYILKDHLRRRKRKSPTTGDDGIQILEVPNRSIDIFINCSDADDDWLYEEVVPRIEESWGYTTFSRRRDVDPGHLETSLAAALNSAAICMCFISPHFCRNPICEWQLEMILAKGEKSILLFYKEEISSKDFPYISKIMRHYNHLEYGEGETEREACWEKLNTLIQRATGRTNVGP